MIQAPGPALGLNMHHADMKGMRRREALSSAALFIALSRTFVLAGTLITWAIINALPASEGRARVFTPSLSLMIEGFLCVLVDYILGASASRTRRDKKAKLIAMATLGGFLVLGLTCALIHSESGRGR